MKTRASLSACSALAHCPEGWETECCHLLLTPRRRLRLCLSFLLSPGVWAMAVEPLLATRAQRAFISTSEYWATSLTRTDLLINFMHQSNNSLEDLFTRSFSIELTKDVKCTEAIAVLVLIGITFRFVSLLRAGPSLVSNYIIHRSMRMRILTCKNQDTGWDFHFTTGSTPHKVFLC